MGRLSPNIQTMTQRLGFRDPDLTQAGHDQIIFWLQKEVLNCLGEIFPIPQWTETQIASGRATAKRIVQAEIGRLQRKAEFEEKALYEYRQRTPSDPKRAAEAQTKCDTLKASIARLSALPELGQPPHPKIVLTQTPIVEYPIDNGNERSRAIVGYADLLAVCDVPKDLRVEGYYDSATEFRDPGWHINTERRAVLFEAKTQLPTFGELMRQLRTYGTYFRGTIAVVAPDDRFAVELKGQGIHFFKYPLEIPRESPAQATLI